MSAKVISGEQTMIIRDPDSIFLSRGKVENGELEGRWHFSYQDYHHRDYTHFGSLRLLNDYTLSPGASLPAHLHSNVEIVTYCADGEIRIDQSSDRFRKTAGNGDECNSGALTHCEPGQVLEQGWVEHTSAGNGICHAEINNSKQESARFIQAWFLPSAANLAPSIQVMKVDTSESNNRFLPLVDNWSESALKIASDAKVFLGSLGRGMRVTYELGIGRGLYLYMLKGGQLLVNGTAIPELAAVKVIGGEGIGLRADGSSELLLFDVPLAFDPRHD